MKNGNYCEYKGFTYRYTTDMDGNSIISTDNSVFADASFDGPNARGLYKKKINKNELSRLYKVENVVYLEGHKLELLKEDGQKFLIGTDKYELADRFGLERVDKYYYQVWIDKSMVIAEEVVTELI